MKFLYCCVTGVLMVLSVDFAISNQGLVELTLWPFAGSATIKVYILAFGVFVTSFFAGGCIAWLGAGKTRRRLREAEGRVREEQREIVELKRKLDKVETISSEYSNSSALVTSNNIQH
ncbi:MAG: LapA family protein [Pseudomonadota bacterium]|nr:LapA family protein [Pseudomonadota bacterium]